jgi:hypothetical protein
VKVLWRRLAEDDRLLAVDQHAVLDVPAYRPRQDHAFDIAPGDRIAQLIVMPVPRARFIPVETLPESVRGEGGFGSTGYQAGASPLPTSGSEASGGTPHEAQDDKDGVRA